MGIEREFGNIDENNLLQFTSSASDFGGTPGMVSDESVKTFLESYPLPLMFKMIEVGNNIHGLESAAINALNKIFHSNYGAKLLPSALPYSIAGLSSPSPSLRQLACSTIGLFLKKNVESEIAVQEIIKSNLISPLFNALTDTEAGVATAAADAVKWFCKSNAGSKFLFSDSNHGSSLLSTYSSNPLSTIRMRILSLSAELASASDVAAMGIKNACISSVLIKEIESNDVLTSTNALEILCEFASSNGGIHVLKDTNLASQLAFIILKNKNTLTISPALKSIAFLISPPNQLSSYLNENDKMQLLTAINTLMEENEHLNNESQIISALEALCIISNKKYGAELLLSPYHLIAKHILKHAFDFHSQSEKHLAAVHSFACLAGSERGNLDDSASVLLSDSSESILRQLVFSAAQNSKTGLYPSGAFWLLLKHAEEMRIATYRLLSALVARSWALMEILSNSSLVHFVTDPHSETNKLAMEWRHSCCVAISSSASAFSSRGFDLPTEICAKFEAAARCGPYLTRSDMEPRPIVIVDHRPVGP